jgi:carbamoyl-phosphate synthase small subunit
MNAVISTEIGHEKRLLNELSNAPSMEGLELASKVSTKEPYTVGNPKANYKIAALDLGIKQNILNNMVEKDMYVKVFPYNSSFEELEAFNPDGYFISNGPGDPQPLKEAQALAKKIIGKNKPLFGICLGHQIIALANGIPTFKMFNGHRGINHPVKNLLTGKGEITSQNHGFAVEMEAARSNPEIEITHIHLNDETLAGMRMKNKNCFSVQYHPEAGPGPNDATYLFDTFKEYIKK